ncbi:molybdate ABC transporter permease subunit [Persicobacter diffluens]|uniref:Molybdenum transport system permease n=1 Tax=Persicobacter diffluens TaxID=981 RepID=A0AAN4W0Q9_9BACT|nr:molybdenum ABC transporter permease subunit [Persicobacter diffluens]
MDWNPIFISLKLAFFTTLILLLAGIPMAYYFAFNKKRWGQWADGLFSLPLIIPPTVLGFYLLMLFSPNNFFGHWLKATFGWELVFNFSGLLLASIIYNLPFMMQPLLAGFRNLPEHLREASFLLGKGHLETLWKVLLPNMRPAFWTSVMLTFAHTLGEFGLVLMIGGNIPGKTRLVSIMIFEEVETLNYAAAHQYSLILLGLSLLSLFTIRLASKLQQHYDAD